MNNNSSKQVLLSVIGVAILVVAVVGVSFAFFSYTRTGGANVVETGTIVFTASTTEMTLENQFPTTQANAKTATVKVSGSTSYDSGIDFRVTVGSFQNKGLQVNNGTEESPVLIDIVPTIAVTNNATGLTGVTVENVYDGTTPLTAGTVLCTGHIDEGTGLEAEELILTISAYYDMNKYHISDNTKDELVAAKLLPSTYAGTIVKTSVWNALTGTYTDAENNNAAYSFTINITAVEGGSDNPRVQ